ncbi:MAG TPA: response regulator transcription factor [Solirubrobacterales bacterium]|jgi:DNA-binding NarL/FixJ family response regulator|nr:response regulator transcription factor [Solirubrobacterales bacterium]
MPSIVIADSEEMQDRIAAALAGHGLRPSAQISAPGDLFGWVIDLFTTLVFVCNVDEPREMADLRRLCRQTRPAATVVISPPSTGTGVRRALDAGADALVFDSELELTLAAAIHAVASGQSVVPRKLRASVERPSLSHRELQVLSLVRLGLTNAEIAQRLFLAESTVKSHLSSAFTKLGVHSRREAITVLGDLERTPA